VSIENFKNKYHNVNVEKFIKINIFDNNNENVLQNLLSEYIEKYPYIYHVFNGGNIGSDANIAKCYKYCSSDYCHVLGDDDAVNKEYIEDIYNAINSGREYGFVFLKTYSYSRQKFRLPNNLFSRSKEFSNLEILEKFNIKLTFISSIVIRNNYNLNGIEFFFNTGLIQLVPICQILLKYKNFLQLNKYLVLAKANNNQVTTINDDICKKEILIENNLIDIYCNSFFKILGEYNLKLSPEVRASILSKFFFYELLLRKKNISEFFSNQNIIINFSDNLYFKLLSRVKNQHVLNFLVFFIMVTKRLISDEFYKIIISSFIRIVHFFNLKLLERYNTMINKVLSYFGRKFYVNVFINKLDHNLLAGKQTLMRFNSFQSGNLLFNTSKNLIIFGKSIPEYSFIPNVSGLYLINTQIQLENNSSNISCDIFINDQFYKRGILGNNQSAYISCVAYLNGRSDFLQVFVYSSENIKVQETDSAKNYFQAVLLK
jgi:hypothetical protein